MKEKMKMSSIKNIILMSKTISNNEKRYKSRALPRSLCQSALEFRAFFVRLPIPRFLSHPYLKMLGCRSRADVATLPRRDVAVTSMLYSSLLQKLLPQLLFLTWQSLPCFTLHCSKNCFHSCSFRSTVPIFKTDTKSGV